MGQQTRSAVLWTGHARVRSPPYLGCFSLYHRNHSCTTCRGRKKQGEWLSWNQGSVPRPRPMHQLFRREWFETKNTPHRQLDEIFLSKNQLQLLLADVNTHRLLHRHRCCLISTNRVVTGCLCLSTGKRSSQANEPSSGL